ncbi:hypothetical protein ACF5F0_003959 [Salmonella enterica]
MADLSVEKLSSAIEKGKVRGFDEMREINGENYFFQYAIKKQGEKYSTYFFCIPENKMDLVEDYATEEIKMFLNIDGAINYFKLKNIDIERFSYIKGTLPF